MSHRVFVTGSGICSAAEDYLLENNCELMTGDPNDSPEELVRKLSVFSPDALIVRQGKITDSVQAAAPSLKVICKHGVGTDKIDIDSATRRDIPVFFTPRANFESAAEHTVALMLSLIRRIPLGDARVRRGIFDKKTYDGVELSGKVLGLIGFGRIGRRVAELVAPFQVTVLVYHPSQRAETLPQHIRKVRGLQEVLRAADIVSLHCPLTDGTRHLINADTMSVMKRGVHLINTARGGLVDEAELIAALGDGRIRGAALDVFESEPPPAEHPLFELDNVIVTAHVAGVSDESSVNMGMDAARSVLAFLDSGRIDAASLKNPEVLATHHGSYS